MKNQDYKLHQFLVKHRAMRRFKKAVEEDGDYTYQEQLEFGETDSSVISGAFVWRDTPEYVSYWARLNYLYRKSFD